MTQWEYLPTFLKAEARGKEIKAFLAEQPEVDKTRRFMPESMIPELNKLGADGWELIHMEPVAAVGRKGDVLMDGIGVRWSNTYFCVFKRMKPGSTVAAQPPAQQPAQPPVQPPTPQPGGED